MKVVLKGRLVEADHPGGGMSTLQLHLDGKVDGVGANGRDARAVIELTISDRYANTLGLGDEYQVTIVAEKKSAP